MTMNEIGELLPAIHRVSSALCISGEAGIGKSDLVKDYCNNNNIHYEVLMLGNQDVGDLLGIPDIEKKGEFNVTTWARPEWLQNMYDAVAEGKEVCLFLDELNRAQPDVKHAALQLILDRKIHLHKLPENKMKTLIVSAINPDDSEHSSYQVQEMDPALVDRLIVVDTDPDVNSWVSWAKRNDIHPIVLRYIIDKGVKHLYSIPEDGSKRATPRGWVTVAKHLKDYEESDLPRELLIPLIGGIIGHTLAASFYLYYDEFSKNITVETIEDMVENYKSETDDVEDIGILIRDDLSNQNVDISTILEITEQLIGKIPEKLIDDSNWKKANPDDYFTTFCMLYSLPIESLAGVLHNIKSTNKGLLRLISNLDTLIHPSGRKELMLKLQSRDN